MPSKGRAMLFLIEDNDSMVACMAYGELATDHRFRREAGSSCG